MGSILLGACSLFATLASAGPAASHAAGQAADPPVFIPSVGATRQETPDEDFTRSSGRTTAIMLTREAGDSIDDSTMPEEAIPGVENFTGKLDKELVRHGVDVPRYKILKNAEKAWGVLEEAYTPLSNALIPLAEARDMLGNEIIPTLQEVLGLGDEAERATQGSFPGIIRVTERRNETHEELVARYNEMIEQAHRKVAEAGPFLDRAEAVLPEAFERSRVAGKLDAYSHFKSASSRTRDRLDDTPAPLNSQRVIHGATVRLDAAVKQARKVQVFLDKLTDPESGFMRKAAKTPPRPPKKKSGSGCPACDAAHGKLPSLLEGAAGESKEDPDQDKAPVDDSAARAALAKAQEQYSRIRDRELGEQDLDWIDSELPETLSTPHSRAVPRPERKSGPPGKEEKSKKIVRPGALSIPKAELRGNRLWTGEQ